MSIPDNLLEYIVTAIMGGGTAASTVLAFFTDAKRRLDELEKRLGSADTKTGLVNSVDVLEEDVKRIRTELDDWAQSPPDWVVQAINAAKRRSAPTYLEEELTSIAGQIRSAERRLKELEDLMKTRFREIEDRLDGYVSTSDFDVADEQTNKEMVELRTTMAEIKGLLQGLQSALDLMRR